MEKVKAISVIIFYILWFFIFPVLISIWLFWVDSALNTNVTFDSSDVNKKPVPYYSVSSNDYPRTDLFSQIKYSIKKIAQTPLGLDYYNLCFINNSRIEVENYNQIVEIYKLDVTLYDISGEKKESYSPITISLGETKCLPVNRDERLTYKSGLSGLIKLPSDYGKVGIKIEPAASVAEPLIRDQYSLAVIFTLFWWGLSLIFYEIIKLFKDQFIILSKPKPKNKHKIYGKST